MLLMPFTNVSNYFKYLFKNTAGKDVSLKDLSYFRGKCTFFFFF